MKIIYDTEQPREKRIEFIGPDGSELDDCLTIEAWKIEKDDELSYEDLFWLSLL